MKSESRLIFSLDDVFGALRDMDREIQKALEARWDYSVDKPPTLPDNKSSIKNKTMKSAKFATAVMLAIGIVRQERNAFSIYDVTSRLRNMIRDGDLSLKDQQLEDVDGVQTFRVDHQEVRELFIDLLSNKVLVNLNSRFNGSFNEFSNASSVSQSLPAPTPVVAKPLLPVFTPVVSIPKTNSVMDPLVAKLKDYLNGKRNCLVSMKQIQSRFDSIRDHTCRDYATLVESLGVKVDKKSPHPSHWFVVVNTAI